METGEMEHRRLSTANKYGVTIEAAVFGADHRMVVFEQLYQCIQHIWYACATTCPLCLDLACCKRASRYHLGRIMCNCFIEPTRPQA